MTNAISNADGQTVRQFSQILRADTPLRTGNHYCHERAYRTLKSGWLLGSLLSSTYGNDHTMFNTPKNEGIPGIWPARFCRSKYCDTVHQAWKQHDSLVIVFSLAFLFALKSFLWQGEDPSESIPPPVPIDICVRPEVRAVIITGPNTGGKTASMKVRSIPKWIQVDWCPALSCVYMCQTRVPSFCSPKPVSIKKVLPQLCDREGAYTVVRLRRTSQDCRPVCRWEAHSYNLQWYKGSLLVGPCSAQFSDSKLAKCAHILQTLQKCISPFKNGESL